MLITGFPVKASEQPGLIADLYEAIVNGTGAKNERIKKVANDLKNASGKSLVVAGSNDVNIQILINAINNALDSYGNTIDLGRTTQVRQGSDKLFGGFCERIERWPVRCRDFFTIVIRFMIIPWGRILLHQ